VSDRATRRHRSEQRPSTALSVFSSNVSDHVGTIGRGGVVIAMSSGLIATMGLPAQAIADKARQAAASAPLAISNSFLAGSSTTTAGAQDQPLSAPAGADVAADGATFSAVPGTGRSGRHIVDNPADLVAPITGVARGSVILAVAARYFGVPYRYGGTTPLGFDCSGYVRYVFANLGMYLPRTADEQLNATRRISRSNARRGDLVFFISGGRAYHVGIYAGDGYMYDAPRPGQDVKKQAIWSSAVVFGRVTA